MAEKFLVLKNVTYYPRLQRIYAFDKGDETDCGSVSIDVEDVPVYVGLIFDEKCEGDLYSDGKNFYIIDEKGMGMLHKQGTEVEEVGEDG